MRVWQVPLTADSMLEALWELLGAPNLGPLDREGDLRADLAAGPLPARQDRSTATACVKYGLPGVMSAAARLVPAGCVVKGAHFYPPGGGMGWHTNTDAPGWRVYVVRPRLETGECGVMKVEHSPNHRSHLWDRHVANVFQLTAKARGQWHSIESYCGRSSIGVHVPDEYALALIAGRVESCPG